MWHPSCRIILLSLLLFTLDLSWGGEAWGKDGFVLVIDAGHGGKDPGAVNKARTRREKDINLRVALQLGKIVSENCPDVKVIYTRKSDVFVGLKERAAIANRAGANLFISIHTNAAPSTSAYGLETFTLGSRTSQAAMEVAMQENKSILFEDNYLQKYDGFDPNSTESYIAFELVRSREIEKSAKLAELVQDNIVRNTGHYNRGVYQANLLVLRETLMPSILVEVGFITNSSEGEYLTTDDAVQKLASGIYRGFTRYRQWQKGDASRDYTPAAPAQDESEETVAPQQEETSQPVQVEEQSTQPVRTSSAKPAGNDKKEAAAHSAPLFKVQLLASAKRLSAADKRLKGLKTTSFKDGRNYIYTYGATTNYNEALRLKKKVASKFPKAFIIAFRGGKKMDVQEAIKEFKKNNRT